LHYRGRYVIRMVRRGDAFVYDISARGNMDVLLAAGFDMLSGDEETALEGITNRLYGKVHDRAA
jgi:hypothetical protein